ncbi:MAG: hypothetical protein ACYTBJ_25585 [Planctomycetota bacterium]
MKIVLFLGAGFSRAYGLPVMRDFFGHAKKGPYLEDDDKAFLEDYQRKTYGAANMFRPEYANLEDVLSFCLALENFAGSYPEDTSADYKRLCKILYEVYRHVQDHTLAYWNLPTKQLGRFLQISKKDEYSLTIVTTNYDIIVEYLFCRLNMRCHLPNEWPDVREPAAPFPKYMYAHGAGEGPLLCKLHGSLNWFSDGPEKLKVEGGMCDCEVDTGTDEPKRVLVPAVATVDYSLRDVPLIVPPTLFKLQVDPRFQRIWEAAGGALKEADKVMVIGFSFPPSDIYIRYWLAANLADNMNLERIAVVDPRANELCDMLTRSDSKFGERFKMLLRAFTHEWHQAANEGAINILS